MSNSASNDKPAKPTVPTKRLAAPFVVPPDIRDLLGPAPITELEDEETYERILYRVAQAVSPADYVEWLWVKDIVDLTLDASRCRSAKVARLAAARKRTIEILQEDRTKDRYGLEFLHRPDEVRMKMNKIDRCDDNKHESVAETLARLGLTEQSIEDDAHLSALADLERLQELIDAANARRDAVLREIDRRRDSFARRVRQGVEAIDNIIDAEFE
jgi:hypothetical protein